MCRKNPAGPAMPEEQDPNDLVQVDPVTGLPDDLILMGESFPNEDFLRDF